MGPSEAPLYPPLTAQVAPVVATLSVRVERPWIALRASSARERWRREHGRMVGSTAVRWLLRTLERSGWRYVIASDPTVEWQDDVAEYFEQGVVIYKAWIRVLFPPALPLDGVERLETKARVVEFALPMPRTLTPEEHRGRGRHRRIERNRSEIRKLERDAVRITQGPAGRCFDMGDGRLLTVKNAPSAGDLLEHIQWVLPITQADAEDFYGWTSGSS